MESSSLELKKNSIKGILLTILLLSCLFSGIIAYFVNSFMYSNQINNLEHKISQLEQQLDSITTNISGTTNEYPVLLSDLFEQIRLSVVVVQATIRQINILVGNSLLNNKVQALF